MGQDEENNAAGAIGWKFPFLNDGTREGFNVAALDMFKSERLQALVREMIQNSLDARDDKSHPVVVRFTLHDENTLDSTGFNELRKYFDAALRIERTEDGRAFYRRAIEQIDDGAVVMLGVHDYNTKGLTGPTYDPPSDPQSGPWLALVKGAGMTFKDSNAALGSFGHGSRAPFAMSELRTLFYFSRISVNGSLEARFQGKSILQSVPLNNITGDDEWSVATGYFGRREKCLPLTDDEIPSWVIGARPEPTPAQPSVGTSIFIPEPFDVGAADLLWAQVKLAIVANFYYAVLKQKLVVYLDTEVITSDNIGDMFDEVEQLLLDQDLQTTDKVMERFESARTVRHHENEGVLQLDGFGPVDWHLRLDGIIGRRVGVARGNGMLITRRAEKLQVFPGMRPFDLFVCVVGDQGSEILRKLENPEHTEFAFDRINDPEERKRAEVGYRQFTDAVRELIREHASIAKVESENVDDLDDFFRADFGAGPQNEQGEPSRTLRIAAMKVRTHRENKPSDVPGGDSDGQSGSTDGEAPGTRRGPGGGGAAAGTGKGRGSLKTGLPVKELRIVRHNQSTGFADVAFTPVDGSRKTLVLLRSGESETSRVRFRTEEEAAKNGPWHDSITIPDLSATARKRLILEFEPEDLEFAIEGRLIS